MLEAAYAKNYTLILSEEDFQKYGISHPLGEGMYGLLDYIPNLTAVEIDKRVAELRQYL